MRLTFLLFLFMWIASAQTTAPAVQLEAGIAKEEVDGDLKSAMEVYQKIAADSSAPRDVRAKALLRLAGCDEKLGRQAKQLYEQIVREYADQPAASQARTRLATLKQQEHPAAPTTMITRKIEWSAVGEMGDSDTDGHRAVFADSTGSLFFGDLAGRNKQLIFKAEPDRAPTWVPARDFSMACIRLQSKPNHPGVLAVVKTDGTGYRELIRDDAQDTILGFWSGATWSWDDRYLLVRTLQQNASRKLWLVNVANGQRRELLSTDAGYFSKAVFSPDGRFIAYEIAPLPDQAETSRVFVMPIQGGHAGQVYESVPKPAQHGLGMEVWTLLDWTADGRYLALADAPKGKTALYLLPMRNGAADGNPVFIRYGEFASAYTTGAGALLYQTSTEQADFFLSSFNSDGRLETWKRLDIRGGNRMNPLPSFTSDSSHIAYVAEDEDPAGGASLVLHDLSNSSERVLFRSGRYLFCQSATRAPVIYCTQDKGNGRTDLTSVSSESGEVQLLRSFQDPKGIVRWRPQLSQDGKALYLTKFNLMKDGGPLVSWDLATHQETAVIEPREYDRFHMQIPSSDDRFVIGSGDAELSVRGVSGGDWKPLVHGKCWPFSPTPDSKAVIYVTADETGRRALFRVPIDGGKPQRLGDVPIENDEKKLWPRPYQGLWISPDGRCVLLVSVLNNWDLWLLDNFIPAAHIRAAGGEQ
jgi:Tol biopolymer transport system component